MTDAVLDCSYCGRPFTDDRLLALHKGHEHANELTETERIDYRNAREAEAEALRIYQIKALVVLVFLYFGFLFAYRILG